MNNDLKRTSFMRYRRVNKILNSDNLLKLRLGDKTTAVCKPDQTYEDFPVEVVRVTDEIHKQGADSGTMSKNDIIRIAHRLLIQNESGAARSEPVKRRGRPPKAKPMEAAQVPAQAAQVPVPKRRGRPPKAKPMEASAQVPVQVPVPKRRGRPPKAKPMEAAQVAQVAQVAQAAQVPVPKRRGRPPKAKPMEAAQVPAHVPTQVPLQVPEPVKRRGRPPKAKPMEAPPEFVRPFIPNVIGVAAMTNAQAVLTLFEPFGDAEAKPVRQKANELIDEIYRRVILTDSARKENTNAS